MTPRTRRFAVLLSVTALLWIAGLVPWPGVLGYLEPAKPSVIAMAFALIVHRLRTASWPLVVAFSLTFFLYNVVMLYYIPDLRHTGMPGAGDDTRVFLTYFGAIVFSPITLWGPMLFGCGAYAVALRLWPNRQVERLSA
jgi:hypothetical protein